MLSTPATAHAVVHLGVATVAGASARASSLERAVAPALSPADVARAPRMLHQTSHGVGETPAAAQGERLGPHRAEGDGLTR